MGFKCLNRTNACLRKSDIPSLEDESFSLIRPIIKTSGEQVI